MISVSVQKSAADSTTQRSESDTDTICYSDSDDELYFYVDDDSDLDSEENAQVPVPIFLLDFNIHYLKKSRKKWILKNLAIVVDFLFRNRMVSLHNGNEQIDDHAEICTRAKVVQSNGIKSSSNVLNG